MSKKLQRDVRKQKATKGARTSGAHKRFSREEFEETKRAVDVIIQYFEGQETHVDINHADRFGPDLIEWEGFRPVRYIEVAQRSAWKSGDWNPKWDPVNIEERKLHLFSLSLPCDYWVISKDFRNALIVRHEIVVRHSGKLEEVQNRAVRSGELFIRIPLDECEEIRLDE